MQKFILIFLFAPLFTMGQQPIPMMNFTELEPRLYTNDGNTWVVNFWATWCAPCVKEMPYFEKIGEDYADKGVKILLVSLDFVNHLEQRVIPFVKEHNLGSEVILLDNLQANSWIMKVSEKWSGALPATLVFNNHHRSFYEQNFTFEQLEAIVKKALTETL